MEINKIESGRYLILEKLGEGNSANVYKVKDIITGEILALKKYKTHDIFNRQRLMADVERELSVLKYTSHPGLPKVFNILYKDDNFYLVMEYVEGMSLKEYKRNKHFIRKKTVMDIGMQLLSAMYYLHCLNPPIVYRDLKPSNIIMMDDGTIKLVDFGNAKRFNRDVSADLKAYGTPGFAAPEQYGDRNGNGIYNTDIRTDIYGTGCVLYYLAAGIKLGEKGHTLKKILYRIRFGRKFHKTIKKATKIYPKNRFSTDIEMMVHFFLAR